MLLILLGALVFQRVGQPLVRRLAESEQLFRGVFQGATDGMMMADPVTGQFTRANRTICQMLDRGEEEIRELGVKDIVPEDALPYVMDQFARQVRGELTSSAQIPLRRKDGSVLFADISAANIEWSGRSQMLGIFRDVTERKQAEEALRESRDRLRKLAARLDEVREVERNLLARELHDAVGQALTAMRWDLDTLEEELPEGQDTLVHRIHSMIDVTTDAMERVNRMSHELRSPVLELLGLEAAVEAHAEELQVRTGVEVESDFDLGDLKVRAERDEVVLRIFQESMSNVLRHAEASNVWLRLRVEGEDVVLEVLDDGSGITDEQMQDSGSFGLIGMRERAGRLGGSVEISRHSEGGTRVRAEIPIEPANGG